MARRPVSRLRRSPPGWVHGLELPERSAGPPTRRRRGLVRTGHSSTSWCSCSSCPVLATSWNGVDARCLLGRCVRGWSRVFPPCRRARQYRPRRRRLPRVGSRPPINYANGNCALFVLAAIPALHLASRREVPTLVRGVSLAACGALVDLLILTQSRASLVFVPLALLVYLALVPGRLRSLLALVLVGVSAARRPVRCSTYTRSCSPTNPPRRLWRARRPAFSSRWASSVGSVSCGARWTGG